MFRPTLFLYYDCDLLVTCLERNKLTRKEELRINSLSWSFRKQKTMSDMSTASDRLVVHLSWFAVGVLNFSCSHRSLDRENSRRIDVVRQLVVIKRTKPTQQTYSKGTDGQIIFVNKVAAILTTTMPNKNTLAYTLQVKIIKNGNVP